MDLDQTSFLVHVADQFRKHGRDWDDAYVTAKLVLADYLIQSGIEFGDPRHGWTALDAKELANEELQHWEE